MCRKPGVLLLAGCLAGGLLLSIQGTLSATQYDWNDGDGSWHDPNNWYPSTSYPHLSSDIAIVDQGEAQITEADAEVAELYIGHESDGDGTGTVVVDHGRSLVLYSDSYAAFLVGESVGGTFIQDGDVWGYSWSQRPSLYIGVYADATGVYQMTGGSLYNLDAMTLGYQGMGTFVQGGNNLGVRLRDLYVGEKGTGYYAQSAGSLIIDDVFNIGQDVDQDIRGVGYFEISGGYVETYGVPNVGLYGSGTFVQTGGKAAFPTCIAVGIYPGSYGLCKLLGGTMNVSSDDSQFGVFSGAYGSLYVGGSSYYDAGLLYIGESGSGVATQEGGSLRAYEINIGGSQEGGYYELSQGTIQVIDANEVVGFLTGGWGIFTQTGGSHGIAHSLCVGAASGSEGTYNLSGGSLAVAGYILVGGTSSGVDGLGVFNQTGGYNLVDTLLLAPGSASEGIYTLDGGLLSADTLDEGSGDGNFIFTGGTLIPQYVELALVNNGGLLHPGGDNIGTVSFTGGGTCYEQTWAGALEIRIDAAAPNTPSLDTLTMNGACVLDGTLKVEVNYAWTRPGQRHAKMGTMITSTGSAITGECSTCVHLFTSAPTGNVNTSSYPAKGLFADWVDPNDTYHCILEFNGYTNGDATKNCTVDSGDLSVMTGNWGATSGMTWDDGDFSGDGDVDSGDLSLLTGNWGWTCLRCNPSGKQGGDGGKEYLPELKDRDGDGDFDIDDVHIILKELGLDPTDDSKDAADQDGGQDSDGWQSSISGGSLWVSPGARYARLAAMSPLTLFGCLWLGCTIHALARPRWR